MSTTKLRRTTAVLAASVLAGSTLLAGGSAQAGPAVPAAPASDNGRQFRVLVFTGSQGAPHAGTAAGVQAIKNLGDAQGFTVQVTDDRRKFDAAHLKQYRVVVFLNSAGDVLDDAQQAAFEAYYRNGGGFVGVHAAIDAEPDWPFLTEVLGTRSAGTAGTGTATVKVADRVHPASKDLPLRWEVAALITWLITAVLGFTMLGRWASRGGLRPAAGATVPTRLMPALVFSHFLLAAIGLVLWIV